jgi:hypothetical protein
MSTDLLDLDPLSKFMCFAVGPNGSGKSIAIASWKEKGSIYYFDFDGRMNSVANWSQQRGLKRGQLQSDSYGPMQVYEAYEKMCDFSSSCPHAAIVLDSFTSITIAAVTFSLKTRQGIKGKDAPKMSKGGLMVPDWDEFNGEATYVTMMLDLSRQIAANGTAVFWTAHPVERLKVTAGQGGTVSSVGTQTKYAAIGMKSDALVPIYFNEIYHFIKTWDFERVRYGYVCQTQSTEVAAKTALNLPAQMDWTGVDSFYKDTFLPALEEGNRNNKGEMNGVI